MWREIKAAFGTLGVILFAGFLFVIIRWSRMKKGMKVALGTLGMILLTVLLYVAFFPRPDTALSCTYEMVRGAR